MAQQSFPYKVTFSYTTGNISGLVGGPAEYFGSLKEAMDYYMALRFGTLPDRIPKDMHLDRPSVTLWIIEGWRKIDLRAP